jgi:putative ABC transport system permease protein
MYLIEGILVEGLLYGIVALGVFITLRIMDFPDLTVDGSFPLGAAVMAAGLGAGLHPALVLFLAFASGAAAGLITASLHNYLKMPNLLASILTMTMLWSINIRIMGKPNVALLGIPTILSRFKDLTERFFDPAISYLIIMGVVVLVIKILMDLFFRTDLGITIGAMGNNPQMVISNGMDPRNLKLIGLALSNGLVAIAGAFAAQYNGFADVQLGQGIIIAGLASVMLGELLFKSNRIALLTIRVLLGSILYRALMFLGREYGYVVGLEPSDLKLITGVLVVAAIALTNFRKDTAKSSLQKAMTKGA